MLVLPGTMVVYHKCNNLKSIINAMEMQDHSDQESATETTPEECQAATNQLVEQDQNQPLELQQNPPPSKLATNAPKENLHIISAEALNGIPGGNNNVSDSKHQWEAISHSD